MQVYKNLFNLQDLFRVKNTKTAISLLILLNITQFIPCQKYGVISVFQTYCSFYL